LQRGWGKINARNINLQDPNLCKELFMYGKANTSKSPDGYTELIQLLILLPASTIQYKGKMSKE
jgi:hypothetical protein